MKKEDLKDIYVKSAMIFLALALIFLVVIIAGLIINENQFSSVKNIYTTQFYFFLTTLTLICMFVFYLFTKKIKQLNKK